MVKKDTDVTQDDIDHYSLILIGNPQSNSIWEKLQPQLPVKVTPTGALYNMNSLTGTRPFQAIVPHPAAEGKYILMIGACDLKTLDQVKTASLFTAKYDCLTTSPLKIISKLGALKEIKIKD